MSQFLSEVSAKNGKLGGSPKSGRLKQVLMTLNINVQQCWSPKGLIAVFVIMTVDFYEIFWLDLLLDNMSTNNISEHNMFSDIKSVFLANVSSS